MLTIKVSLTTIVIFTNLAWRYIFACYGEHDRCEYKVRYSAHL